jgi:hypothetical protein
LRGQIHDGVLYGLIEVQVIDHAIGLEISGFGPPNLAGVTISMPDGWKYEVECKTE